MKSSKKINSMTSLLMLMVFSLFSISSFLLVVIGANVYKSVYDGINDNDQIRASLSYVANKVRQNDESGKIEVKEIDGKEVLILNANYDDVAYKTYIYYENGAICESFLREDIMFFANEGEEIVKANSFDIAMKNDMLEISASGKKNKTRTITLKLRSEE